MVVRPKKKPSPSKSTPEIRESKIKIFDIPIELLEGDPLNPNEMSEDKFDELVEGIRNEGFDDPIEVIPHPRKDGAYLIAGGHHRVKAARKAGLTHIPSIIKEGWTEDQQKIALVRRNILHGNLNSQKFTTYYNELAKKYDAKLLQSLLGFTQKKEFEAVYDGVAKNLPAKQRKELAKAKETIKSVDDLSSVLNRIFKDGGSDLEEGYMVFSFGGKEHHYVNIDQTTNKKLKDLKKRADDAGLSLRDQLQSIIANAEINSSLKVAPKKIVRKRPKS